MRRSSAAAISPATAVIGLFLTFGLIVASFFPFLSVYFAGRGFDPSEIGLLLSAMALVRIVAMPVWGHVADTRIGKPLGLATGGAPQPALEESGPSDNSLADMAASLRGIRAIYTGARAAAGTGGIGAIVAAQSPATDREVRDLLDRAIDAVGAIPRPFRAAIVDQRALVQAAYDAVKELKRVLATEVLAALGATLKFNDNDGD